MPPCAGGLPGRAGGVRGLDAARGQAEWQGRCPSSASIHLTAAVVGLRECGVKVSGDDQAEARAALEGPAVKILQAGERRGQAVGAGLDGLRAVARACPDTLTGDRDKALVLTRCAPETVGRGRCSSAAGIRGGRPVRLLHARLGSGLVEGVDVETGVDAQRFLRGLQRVGIHQIAALLAGYGPPVPFQART